jgi:hypothetical protein
MVKGTMKQEMRNLYEGYAKPGMERWKQICSQANDDFAFLLWATDLVLDELDLMEEDIINACRLDGKWDLKIDSGFFDRQGQKLYLIQAKHWEPSKSVGDAPFFATWESLELLSNPKFIQKANSYTKDFYVDFSEAVKQSSEIVLIVVTSGRVLQPQKDYVASKPKKRNIQIGDIWYEVPVSFKWFGLQQLVDIERKEEITELVAKDEIVTLHVEQDWYCVPRTAIGTNLYDSLYTTVPAEELITIRQRLGPELYKLNYRGPLGDRIIVNKEIFSTLRDIPNTFHVLNNGVAAICDNFSIDPETHEVMIRGFQIVNGCQTIETLYNHTDKVMGKRDVKVNLRLITCLPAQSALVAKATNNQTKLRADDFATLEPVQQDLQLQFSKLQPQPWYYEIKRRYWKNVVFKDKAQRQKFSDEFGTPRIIKLRDAAQRSLAFLGEPITSAQNTALIFKPKDQGGYKEDVFPESLYAYQIMLSWLIYQHINGAIEAYLEEIPEFDERNRAREWLEYGRLTAVALIGDGLREYYKVKQLEYIDFHKSKELVEKIDAWLVPLAKLALATIWNYAKSNKEWNNLGPRTVFRKPQTYENALCPSFMASFQTSKIPLTEGLP